MMRLEGRVGKTLCELFFGTEIPSLDDILGQILISMIGLRGAYHGDGEYMVSRTVPALFLRLLIISNQNFLANGQDASSRLVFAA
jgi:hypothetical protein